MLDERKASILRAVVEEYIQTAQPVGSAHVAKASGVHVSPATIRNEMAVLEQEGYLSQPHTSAGRVPTDKGYRFFVDHITAPGHLDSWRVEKVKSFFESAHGALESMLDRTSRLLASLTSYAAVVVGPPADAATVRSVQLVGLSARVVLVVIVLSNGQVLHRNIEVGEDVSDQQIAAATARVASALVGETVTHLPPIPATGEPALDRLVGLVRDAVVAEADPEQAPVYVGGASQMAAAFDTVEMVRQVLLTLEQQVVVVGLLRDVLDRGLSVAIGAEHGVQPLASCSVVVAPYLVDGEPAGAVGVLGPTRMNYPEALAAVSVVSERLGRRLSDG